MSVPVHCIRNFSFNMFVLMCMPMYVHNMDNNEKNPHRVSQNEGFYSFLYILATALIIQLIIN